MVFKNNTDHDIEVVYSPVKFVVPAHGELDVDDSDAKMIETFENTKGLTSGGQGNETKKKKKVSDPFQSEGDE